MKYLRHVVALLAACSMTLTACTSLQPTETKVTVKNCGTNLDQVCVEVSGTWKKSTADADDLARDLVVTREVDPSHLHYTNGTAKGTLKLTLNDGATVSYSGNLAYSSYWSSRIPARSSGNMVYGFVAANPTAVQAFLDQYRARAISLQYVSNVTLSNASTGEETSTVIESQASHQGVRAFLGSGVGRAGIRDGDGPPEI